ncbi:hypothetical protein BSAF29S_06087 [Bacillus safensis subsp. safensis]
MNVQEALDLLKEKGYKYTSKREDMLQLFSCGTDKSSAPPLHLFENLFCTLSRLCLFINEEATRWSIQPQNSS